MYTCYSPNSTLRTRATQHVTTFSSAKMHGLDSVSCRVVTWRAKWNLGLRQRVARNARHPCTQLWPCERTFGSSSELYLSVSLSRDMNPDSIGLVRLVQLCSVLACFASLNCVNIRTTIDRVALKLFDRQTFLQFSALYCLACKRRDLTRYLVSERVQLKTRCLTVATKTHVPPRSAVCIHARTNCNSFTFSWHVSRTWDRSTRPAWQSLAS